MQITRADLDEASAQGHIGQSQANALWIFLNTRTAQDTPAFRPAHILYYLGGMVAIGAMSLFMTAGWERFGGTGLLVIACAFGVVALAATERLMARGLLLPAGILGALAVAIVPLAVYGAQQALGAWAFDGPWPATSGKSRLHLDWRLSTMEFATLAAGAAALWRYRLPFLVMPIAFTLWFMSVDLALSGNTSWSILSIPSMVVSTCFGIAMVLVAFWTDLRSRGHRDFAFWLYLSGVATFWFSMMRLGDGGFTSPMQAGVDLLLIAIGAALSRRVFAVFGGLGVAIDLLHLSRSVFADSLLFPVALGAIGLAVIAVGIAWQRHEAAIGAWVQSFLPPAVRDMVARRAAS